jgi:hypothetical protein
MGPATPPLESPTTGSEATSVVTLTQIKRERLRFVDFHVTRTQAGIATVQVELEWLDNLRVIGTAQGQSSPSLDLRYAAEAALNALERFGEGALKFELIGIKSLRVFDGNVVIVAINLKNTDSATRLLGCHLADDEPLRSAVIGVLNATNRVLGNFIATR